MPDLAAFQHAFADALVQPGGARDGMAVYRNNWLRAAIEALGDIYPTIRQLLGEEAFQGAAHAFVQAQPPASPILSGYGAGFAEWLGDQPWIADLPYLPDVAVIDRLCLDASLAADAPALDPALLAGLAPADWATLTLRPHPAMRVDWFTTPAPSIWLAHRDSDDIEEFAPDWCAEGLLITRPGLTVQARRIDRAEHRLLFGLRLGETVGEAALAAARLAPDTDFAGLFARMLESGALAAPTT